MTPLPDTVSQYWQRATIIDELSMLPQRYPQSDNWAQFQIGYKVDGNTGEDITGQQIGDFHPSWYVISQNYFADPFIIDSSEVKQGLPVYFAFSSAGSWEPIAVASSLAAFTKLLEDISQLVHTPESLLDYLHSNTEANEFWQEVYEAVAELGSEY